MAQKKKSTPEVEKVRPYLEGVAKNLVDRLYGPDGPAWGTKLTELEDVVVSIREEISEKMLAQALARQAAAILSSRQCWYTFQPAGRDDPPSPPRTHTTTHE